MHSLIQRSVVIFLLLHLCAAVLPILLSDSENANTLFVESKELPTFEGQLLTELPLSKREREFSNGFPGSIRRFSDGSREILMREVRRPTRKLHPSSDCFRGVGFTIKPLPAKVDRLGRAWGCFGAERSAEKLRVCELITASDGQLWYDVSSWFWSALMQQSKGPWIAYTVVES